MVRGGQLSRFSRTVMSLSSKDVLFFFKHQMFVESLVHGHIMISQFILNNGYPLGRTSFMNGIPPALYECLSNEAVSDETCSMIIEFMSRQPGWDINQAHKQTYKTILHVAVRRQLTNTITSLIHHGADVNAVAKGDSMPLPIATMFRDVQEEIAKQGVDTSEKLKTAQFIVDMLLEHGARMTWRRGIDVSEEFGGCASTNVSVGSSIVQEKSKSDVEDAIADMHLSSDDSNKQVVSAVSTDGAFLFSTG